MILDRSDTFWTWILLGAGSMLLLRTLSYPGDLHVPIGRFNIGAGLLYLGVGFLIVTGHLHAPKGPGIAILLIGICSAWKGVASIRDGNKKQGLYWLLSSAGGIAASVILIGGSEEVQGWAFLPLCLACIPSGLLRSHKDGSR